MGDFDLNDCRSVTVFEATSNGKEKWFLQMETRRLKYGTVFSQLGPYDSPQDAWKAFSEMVKR
jgi:hypothetical protein